jgi:hypothetical protein
MKTVLRTAALLPAALAVGLVLHALPAQAFQDKEKVGDKKEKLDLTGGVEILRAEGELLKTDPKDRERTDSAHHQYCLPLVGGKTYVIECKSKEIDSFLRLEDASGKKLAEDDDSAGYPDARIVFKCPRSDTYRVIVTTYGKGAEKAEFGNYGTYTLSVRMPGKGGLAFRNGRATVDGQIAQTDARDKVRQGSFCKVYKIALKAGKTYQIDMVSAQLDSYLRLEDAAGQQLAEDDDGGGFPNARIVFNCQKNGEYRIIATTFAPGATGAFTLTVQQQ